RVHFLDLDETKLMAESNCCLMIQCLLTRSTDCYLRQAALKHVLSSSELWTIPFVVLLACEYVIEIANDLTASLPLLKREEYINFVRNNRSLMRLLRSRATSYWSCYCRDLCPHKRGQRIEKAIAELNWYYLMLDLTPSALKERMLQKYGKKEWTRLVQSDACKLSTRKAGWHSELLE
ncbi:MAG: hypothetical protein K2X81_19825, partial [Candidatus Obscuribacterales bacterium]|nr:hypothetical protein [Candidatus Obscuribacterales bacterium]